MNVKEEEQMAAWHAALALRDVASENGLNWSALAKAMFHAGRATALFQARDVVESLQAKLKQKESKD